MDEWRPRIQGVEETLYGYNLDDTSNPSGLGLTDVITVTKTQIDIHGSDNRDVSFNNKKSVYVTNTDVGAVVTPEVNFRYNNTYSRFAEFQNSSGHLVLMLKDSI